MIVLKPLSFEKFDWHLLRSVVQSAIGILSGSKYHGEGAFSQKLHGEMEPWTSNRTTLIKNHEEGDNAGEKG